MLNAIATTELIAVRPSGERALVRIGVLAPTQTRDGDWSCLIDGGGLVVGPRIGVHGADSWQAICLAFALVRDQLDQFKRSGGRLLLSPDDDKSELPLDAVFGFRSRADRFAAALTDDYDDAYMSCAQTYSTLRIFSDSIEPHEISAALQVEPTRSFRKGDPISVRVPQPRPRHGWLLCTETHVTSRDTRRHVDWLLDRVEPVLESFATLTRRGAESDVYSFWVSSRGQGGPLLSPCQMQRLATLGLECSYDVYFESDDDDDAG